MSKENIMKALKDKKEVFDIKEREIIDGFGSGSYDIEDYVSKFRENRKQIAKYNIIMKWIE